MQKVSKSVLFKITSIFVLIVFSFVYIQFATASALTSLKDTLTSEKASTVANHTIAFTTPTGVAASQTIILTFDNSTSIPAGLDYTDIDLTDDAVDLTLAGSASGATWGVVRTSALVITFTNGTTAVAAGSVITIEIGTNATFGVAGDQQITNGVAGTTKLVITGTFTDTGTIAIPIIADDTVVVNAVVQPIISFTLSDNTIYFGNLSSSLTCFAQGTDPLNTTCPVTTETEAFNMTAGTNATSGYVITIKGGTLTSGGNTITAPAVNTVPTVGQEQFGVRFTSSGGTGTVTAPYAAAGYALSSTSTTTAQIASAPGVSATTTYSARYLATIGTSTEAGIYTTSHTYVATSTF
ncbi:MAG TPA: hypothetical protein PKZ36_00455 [Candidatus Paceibacterota bacterium]|mgnify:CR=1 FL=1|nr:hypothetical protein [Candidatus Paceibacterota bacterium]HPT17870.1 hypothetical protein [Candidatus Paceibacterota bacterium]